MAITLKQIDKKYYNKRVREFELNHNIKIINDIHLELLLFIKCNLSQQTSYWNETNEYLLYSIMKYYVKTNRYDKINKELDMRCFRMNKLSILFIKNLSINYSKKINPIINYEYYVDGLLNTYKYSHIKYFKQNFKKLYNNLTDKMIKIFKYY